MNELEAVQAIQGSQKKWRRLMKFSFIIVVVFATTLFVVSPKILPSTFMQMILLISMGSLFALFFLDRISFILVKQLFKKDILHKYLFQHLKPEDVHRDVELLVEMIGKRRRDTKEFRR